MSQSVRPLSSAWCSNINIIIIINIQSCILDSSTITTNTFPSILIFSSWYASSLLYCVPNQVHILCTRSGVHIVYPIGCTYCVLSLNLLSAEPMPYKARLGARFVYPIGYSVYVPDRVHISVYPPYSEGLLEFCSLVLYCE